MIVRATRTRYGDSRVRMAPVDASCGTVEDVDRLVQRIAERDFAAFEGIYAGFHRLVYAIAHQVLRTENGAEDVTQSVFITV